MLKTLNINVHSVENAKVLCPALFDKISHLQWYAVECSISHLIWTLCLLVSSFAFIFLCSFFLWMTWHSNAVQHIVYGHPAVQRLCGMSRALQQGSPPEIINVHRMCQAGSRKVFQWSLQGHYHYNQWTVGWWSLAESGLYFLYHMKIVALSHTLPVSYEDCGPESYLALYLDRFLD